MTRLAAKTDKTLSERGQLILAAAKKLFLTQGFDSTSLEMIINESGGSRRSIYNEFSNKEGLLMAVLQAEINIQASTLAAINYQLPIEQALNEVCVKFVAGLLSDTNIALFRLVNQVVSERPEVGRMLYEKGPLTATKPLVDYLQQLNDQGKLAITDSTFAALMLIDMVKGHLHLKKLLIPATAISLNDIQQHISQTIPLFLNAYKACRD